MRVDRKSVQLRKVVIMIDDLPNFERLYTGIDIVLLHPSRSFRASPNDPASSVFVVVIINIGLYYASWSHFMAARDGEHRQPRPFRGITPAI